MALAEAKSGDVNTRTGALRVALALPMSHGHPILWDLVIDPEPEIRAQVFERAIAAQHDGLQLMRRAAESNDDEMATTAVRHLAAALDRPSLPIMRRLLNHAVADIRMRAATFLGWTAGPAVRPKLQTLASSDPETSVREAAQAALDTLGDTADCPAPVWWWERNSGGPAAAKKKSKKAKAAPKATTPKPVDADSAQDNQPTVADLVRAAGKGGKTADDAWTTLDDDGLQEVGRLLASARPDDDHDLCVGLARCVAHYARPHWTVLLRPLLAAEAPELRAHAVAALGEIAGPSQVPWFRPLFADDAGAVRHAAVVAFVRLCARLERPELLVSYLGPLTNDADATVNKAVNAALSS